MEDPDQFDLPSRILIRIQIVRIRNIDVTLYTNITLDMSASWVSCGCARLCACDYAAHCPMSD
jgi:hypothetical protein